MKNSISKLLIVILFTIISSNSFAQKVPQAKKQEQKNSDTEIRIPTVEEINKQSKALTQEDKNKSESVINNAKKT